VVADFIDLKSPYMAGYSRRCAQLGVDAPRLLGFAGDAITTLRRAALVHEFGTTAVPNSIWDKPFCVRSSLTRPGQTWQGHRGSSPTTPTEPMCRRPDIHENPVLPRRGTPPRT
jgi:hypothetical protein